MRSCLVLFALFIAAIAVATENIECNIEGYKAYLSLWTEEQKGTSRDPESEEFQKRLE